jgi:predicted enzyme involved in methoxymalonyl-ACP biosynthesis
VIVEMKDNYGDMGRCAVPQLRPHRNSAAIESLAISCRTSARGLSLSMLVRLLRHAAAGFQELRCWYIANGLNRPLRFVSMAAGFRREPDTDELILTADRLASTTLPDWIEIVYS